jgi:hypothetical protein
MKRTALMLLPTLLGLACGEAAMTPPGLELSQIQSAATSAIFSGTVLDATGAPVANARVTINGLVRLTNDKGAYAASIAESRAGYVLDIRKDGYAPLNTFKTAGELSQRYVLAKAFAKVINPAVSNVIVDPASGIQVTLPAGSLQGSTGSPATGQVTFSIAPHGPDTMPGDFSARNASNQPVALETVGAVTLAAVDSAGNSLVLLAGKSLGVSLPVPVAAGGQMPACVLNGSCRAAMWRFDPVTGLWKEQTASSVKFTATGTTFNVTGPRQGSEPVPSDGLGTWNADIEKTNPSCTLIEFVNIPLDCYNPPPGTTPEPGIQIGFEQMRLSGGLQSVVRPANSSTPFIAIYNLRASTDLQISVQFPSGAPTYCAQNLTLNSTPAPLPGYPNPVGSIPRITKFVTGPQTFTGYPKNSLGYPITFTDVATGDHPCGSHVYVETHP